MPTIFDGDNLIVTLPEPDAFGVLQLSWREDVYEAWKDWLLGNGSNFTYAKLFDTFGGNQLTPSLNAGAYFVVQNQRGWRFRPFEADHTVYAVDNLPAQDSLLPIMIPTIGGFTVLLDGIRPNTEGVPAGMAPQVAGIHGQVCREIWLDPCLVANGNGYQQSPYNNLTDAIDDAEANGILSLVVLDDITLDRNLKNFQVRGIGMPTIDFAGFDLQGGSFDRLKLEGNYTSQIEADDCTLLTNMRLNGNFTSCRLAGDLFCVPGGDVFMTNCGSSVPGLGRPTIIMSTGGARVLIRVRDNNGGITIKGSTHADDEVTVEVNRGSLTFDASNTAGAMVARTNGKFVNLSTGAVVTREAYSMETWQRRGNDPDNPLVTHENGDVEVGDIDINAGTVGVSPNRTTTQTRQ